MYNTASQEIALHMCVLDRAFVQDGMRVKDVDVRAAKPDASDCTKLYWRPSAKAYHAEPQE